MASDESDVDGDLEGDFFSELLLADTDGATATDNAVSSSAQITGGCKGGNLEDGFLTELIRQEKEHLDARVKRKVAKLRSPILNDIGNQRSGTSVIHRGDTDSSDDEDNRNQLDARLNDYGRTVKALLTPNENRNENRNEKYQPSRSDSTWSNNGVPDKATLAAPAPPVKTVTDSYTDPVFGMRISNPLISGAALQDRMAGRVAVTMEGLQRFVNNGQEKDADWVLAGAIVSKSPIRTSQKGSQYCIWKLSDLKPGLRTISLFLFNSAFKDLWKTSVGTVIGVLNPNTMDNRENRGDEAALTVDKAQKVMILGTSKDFGTCKATKKNGEKCTALVNKGACDVCVYHVQQEYRKCSRRSELQSPIPRVNALRNKILGKNEVFYGGQSYSAIPDTHNRNHVKKDKNLLLRLTDFNSPLASPAANANQALNRRAAAQVEMGRNQSRRDAARLALLAKMNCPKRDDIFSSGPSKVTADSLGRTSNIGRFGNGPIVTMVTTPKSTSFDESDEIASKFDKTTIGRDIIDNKTKVTNATESRNSISKKDGSKSFETQFKTVTEFDMFTKEVGDSNSSKVATKSSESATESLKSKTVSEFDMFTSKLDSSHRSPESSKNVSTPCKSAPRISTDERCTNSERDSISSKVDSSHSSRKSSTYNKTEKHEQQTSGPTSVRANVDNDSDPKNAELNVSVKSNPDSDRPGKSAKHSERPNDKVSCGSKLDEKNNLVNESKQTSDVTPSLESCGFSLDDLAADFDEEINEKKIPKMSFGEPKTRIARDKSIKKRKMLGYGPDVDDDPTRRRTVETRDKKTVACRKASTSRGDGTESVTAATIDIKGTDSLQRKEMKKFSEKYRDVKLEKKARKKTIRQSSVDKPNNDGTTKVVETKVRPPHVGTASLLGLGLHNRPLSPGTVEREEARRNLPRPAPAAVTTVASRGEHNLKLLNKADALQLPVAVKKTRPPEAAANFRMLSEKRNKEFEATNAASRPEAPSRSSSANLNALQEKRAVGRAASIAVPPPGGGGCVVMAPALGRCLDNVPRLGGGVNGFVDLDAPIPKSRMDRAKLNAKRFIQQNGAFKKADPNDTTANKGGAVKRNLETSAVDPAVHEQVKVDEAAKRAKFAALVDAKSRHTDLLETHYDQEKEEYFDKLEKKEQMEEKMLNTFHVACRAVTCLECKYTSFSAAEICKADGHRLKVTDATKRFFSCADCGNRTVALTRLPDKPCNKCQSSRWQRAPMIRVRKPVTGITPLCIRGIEEKFIGSGESAGHIDLLVPMT